MSGRGQNWQRENRATADFGYHNRGIGERCDRRRGAARERRRWRIERLKQLGRHLALRKQGAGQSLSANPEDEGS